MFALAKSAPKGADEPPHPAMFPPNGGNERSLAEFAPAGANKMGSFLPATCASAKILLGSQTCERSECAAASRIPSNESPMKWVSFEEI